MTVQYRPVLNNRKIATHSATSAAGTPSRTRAGRDTAVNKRTAAVSDNPGKATLPANNAGLRMPATATTSSMIATVEAAPMTT